MSYDGPNPFKYDPTPRKHRPLDTTTPRLLPRQDRMRPCPGCGNPTRTEGCLECIQAHKVHNWTEWQHIRYLGYTRRCRHAGCTATETFNPLT